MSITFWAAAIWGGFIAGGVMLLMLMVLAPFRGFGELFTPVRAIASTVQGETAAFHGGLGTILLGIAVHLVISAFYGIVFTAIMVKTNLALQSYTDLRMAVVGGSGLIYGNLLFIINRFFFMPLLDWPFAKRIPLLDLGAAHIIFGALLGWFVTLLF